MPAALRDDFIGLDEYERLCEAAEEGERLEYIDGQVVRMLVGGSIAHHALTRCLDNLIADRLPGGPCASLRQTMRLQAGTARVYPDVFVACGDTVEPDPETNSVRSATVIVEVLPPATERYDRGGKWLEYQTLHDLMHFVHVAQDQRRVGFFHRQGDGWHYELLQGPDAVLRLAAIGVELRLDDFYSSIPLLATEGGDLATQATFATVQVSGIAGMKGLPRSPDIYAMVTEMDAGECEAAVAAIVGLVGTPAMVDWKSVLPERLQNRLDAVLSASTYY
ncbi:Uma2 family endonuclease [Methylobacterium tardum]|nr:Uma2 family endonuclease [Methylobacterium tardum]URD39756.1 Uma2 family endonuclease [Methylobacterium tardum]